MYDGRFVSPTVVEGSLGHTAKRDLPASAVGADQLDGDLVARYRPFAVEPGNDREIDKLNAGSAFVDVGDHSIEPRSFAALEYRGFGKIKRRAFDLARLLVGPRHDRRQALEDGAQLIGDALPAGDLE